MSKRRPTFHFFLPTLWVQPKCKQTLKICHATPTTDTRRKFFPFLSGNLHEQTPSSSLHFHYKYFYPSANFPPSIISIWPTNKSTKGAFPPLNMSSNNGNSIMMELKKALFASAYVIRTPTYRSTRAMVLVYAFPLFIICSLVFLLGDSHVQQSSEWLRNALKSRSQLSYFFPTYLFEKVPNRTSGLAPEMKDAYGSDNGSALAPSDTNSMNQIAALDTGFNKTFENYGSTENTLQGDLANNSMLSQHIDFDKNGTYDGLITSSSENDKRMKGHEAEISGSKGTILSKGKKKHGTKSAKRNAKPKKRTWLETMSKCDIFDGKWVKDESPPLYDPRSCPHIDESFDCHKNGRPDNDYQKFRWKPNHCTIPRLNPAKMLKFFEGKKIVYVGDSLNRNMWDSMVCMLLNSVKNKSRVFEASGRSEFKTESALSFVFKDYNFSVDYIRSAFLVQEWEMPQQNGSKKETLRLDMIAKSYEAFGDADVLVFNTGNWWTHEKTSEGKGYYQEGDHIYQQLDVVEAFNKAMTTWAKWVEANVNTKKTDVFFRGYTFAHFSKGEWNSGGRCDDKEPINVETELWNRNELSPPVPQMLDNVMRNLRIPIFYQNVTRMTNYRRDAHPSMFRKPNMTEEERKYFETHQDCSHWCLPGVPDTWNELLFAQLLLSNKQKPWKQQHYHN